MNETTEIDVNRYFQVRTNEYGYSQCIMFGNDKELWAEIKKQNVRLQTKEQECEKLKTQILSLQTIEIEELKNYKQAIDDIEKYVKQNDCYLPYGTVEIIQYIINKAKENKMSNSQNLYLDLEKFIKPRLLDDFCGYDEESQSFNIVLAIKQIIEAKEQKCEELKKQLDKYLNQEEEDIRQLNNDNKLDDILLVMEKVNDKMEKELKYKQALDEIENYINQGCGYYIPYGAQEIIRNIINKVKDNSNNEI